MDILLLVLLLAIAFQAGKHWGYFKIVKALKEVADEQGIDLEKELGIVVEKEEQALKKNLVLKLQVETHGDLLYLFDVDEDKFICQGSTVQELAKLAKELKDVKYAAVKHGDKVFAFKDGESVEIV